MAKEPPDAPICHSNRSKGVYNQEQNTGGERIIPSDRRSTGLDEVYGDYIGAKSEDTLRIGLQNIGGFSTRPHDPTDESFRQWITRMEFNIFGATEGNTFWPNVKKELQLWERMKGWWNPLHFKLTFAYNSQDPDIGHQKTLQWGGVIQISLGNAAQKYQAQGKDPRGLGRWTWQLMKGKNDTTLRVITAYRPVSKSSSSTFSVYTQHCKYFNSIGKKNLEPRQCILDDLSKEIIKWKKLGDHIVLMMDANVDVRHKSMVAFLKKVGMRDLILERHGAMLAPRTYISGQHPIDGIFATRSVQIKAGGYAAFSDGIVGSRPDHRCLWVDLKFSDVLGHKMPGPTKFSGRRVNCDDPRVYNKFNSSYKKFAIKNGLARKIFHLESIATYPLPVHLQLEAESIASLRLEGVEYADRRCRKLHMGKLASSPKFKAHQNAVAFWNHAVRSKEGKTVTSKTLQHFLRKSKIKTPLHELRQLSLQRTRDEARKAYKDYSSFCKQADVARQTWLEELSEARAIEEEAKKRKHSKGKNTTKAVKQHRTQEQATSQELKSLKTRESSRQIFSRISRAVGKENLAGLSIIAIPTGTDNSGDPIFKDISTHSDIVNALIVEHTKKYHQTELTPPMTWPLKQQLGYLGIGAECDKILNGDYQERHGTDKFSAMLLKHLNRVDSNAKDLPVGLTGLEYTDGWKKVKERTSSGGKTVHFGHCKAMSKDTDLAEMEAAFLSIPLRSGYSYKYWRKGIDCVLPKKANSNQIQSLRTIVLLESGFNFTNKTGSRKVANRAENTRGGFADEQFGSRKDHRAIDHALNKRVTLDLLRQLKLPGVLCPNDLKSCYDRICHSIASLCMRRQGLAESEAVCMFATLQYLEHTIRCAYGDSTKTYGSDIWAIPMQGIYQGNGAGPVIWAVVSSPVLQIMREAGFGTFFKAAISGEAIRLVGYAFVDDTDLMQTARSPHETIESVISEMQKGMDMWEGLIKATGGALSVVKCRWWAIDFKWNAEGSWSYKTNDETPGSLYAVDFDNLRKPIRRLETHQAFETLGVFLAPDGNQDAQIEKMKDKADAWADRLRTCHLREQETATALKTTILKTLEYPLLVLHLSREQCRKIMAPVLTAALPKSKFNRHFCRRTLFGPGSHLGVSMHQLYTSQVVEHVDGLLRHGPCNTLTGRLLRGSIETAKVELGLPDDLFSKNFKQLGYLITDSWVKSTWKEMDLEGISLKERTECLQRQREHDIFIMARFLHLGFKNITLVRLNRCRIALQVTTLADLCTGDGKYLMDPIKTGINPMLGSSDLAWPNQGPIPESTWRLWRRALKKAFPADNQNKLLRHPLGQWITITPANWRAFHCPQQHITYIRDTGTWRRFQHHPITLYDAPSPTEISPCDNTPPTAKRALAWMEDNNMIYHGSARFRQTRPPTRSSILDFTNQMETEWKWSVPYIHSPEDEQALARSIASGNAIAIADGSFDPLCKRGTAAFCVTLHDGTNGVFGAHETPGNKNDHCAYRSELSGILGILILSRALCSTYNISSGSLVIGCDNIQAGIFGIEHKRPPKPAQNHFDVLQAIFELKRRLPITITYEHVEGHQREKYPERQLDVKAILNDRMDGLAKAYMDKIRPIPQAPLGDIMPHEWSISFNGVKLCKNIRHQLRHDMEAAIIEDMWIKPKKRKGGIRPPKFTKTQIELMDFSAGQLAWDRSSGNRKRFVSKIGSDQLPVGYLMKNMKYWKTDQCPGCLRPRETGVHLLRCSDPRAITHREESISKFEIRLRSFKTHPRIQRAISRLVRNTLLNTPWDVATEDHDIRRVVADQLYLGPLEMIRGRLVKGWSEMQGKAFLNYAPWLNGKSWLASVITALWELHFSIWEHRNEVLHQSEVMDTLLDMESIDLQILEEWGMGSTGLDAKDAYLFKGISQDQLLGKQSRQRREWLRCVQLARYGGEPLSDPEHDLDKSDASDYISDEPIATGKSDGYSSDTSSSMSD